MINLILKNALLIAGIASFILLFMEKTGLRNYIINKSPILISKLFSCDFCLSFWTCLFFAILGSFIPLFELRIWMRIISVLIATPLTRVLL